MTRKKIKWDLTEEEAKALLQQEKETAKEEIKKAFPKLQKEKKKKKNRCKSSERTKLKNPIWKECQVCGKDFQTYYEVVKLCSRECVAEYNSLHAGRPKADLEEIKEAIKPYLQIGCDLREAVLESGVCSIETVHKYKRINEKFRNWIEAMKNFSIIKAKRVIYKAISNNDVAAAKWWLERKKASEFGIKTQTDFTSWWNPIWFTMDLPPSQFWKYDDNEEDDENKNE